MSANGIRHFLDLADLPAKELRKIIDLSRDLKKRAGGGSARPFDGATLAMIFDKPSTRTRVSAFSTTRSSRNSPRTPRCR